jgi:hypothetical protein
MPVDPGVAAWLDGSFAATVRASRAVVYSAGLEMI